MGWFRRNKKSNTPTPVPQESATTSSTVQPVQQQPVQQQVVQPVVQQSTTAASSTYYKPLPQQPAPQPIVKEPVVQTEDDILQVSDDEKPASHSPAKPLPPSPKTSPRRQNKHRSLSKKTPLRQLDQPEFNTSLRENVYRKKVEQPPPPSEGPKVVTIDLYNDTMYETKRVVKENKVHKRKNSVVLVSEPIPLTSGGQSTTARVVAAPRSNIVFKDDVAAYIDLLRASLSKSSIEATSQLEQSGLAPKTKPVVREASFKYVDFSKPVPTLPSESYMEIRSKRREINDLHTSRFSGSRSFGLSAQDSSHSSHQEDNQNVYQDETQGDDDRMRINDLDDEVGDEQAVEPEIQEPEPAASKPAEIKPTETKAAEHEDRCDDSDIDDENWSDSDSFDDSELSSESDEDDNV